mgnify:CR=1 FL=1
MAAATDAAKLAPAARLERLGDVLLTPTPAPINGIAIEALLDAFLVLFDECSYSELKREKIVADFVKECPSRSRQHSEMRSPGPRLTAPPVVLSPGLG